MRRLTPDEHTIVSRIAEMGGSYCPSSGTLDHPDAVSILRSLKSKKRIFEVEDTDLPTFRLSQQGWNDAQS